MAPKRRVYRTTDCAKYLKWKAERAQKFQKKKKEKKRKKKEPVLDCVDEDEVQETETPQAAKISYRKCKDKKRRKKKKPKRLVRKIYKHVSYADLLLNCIKPSLEEREFLNNPIHARCLGLDTTKLSFKPEIPVVSQTYAVVRRKKSAKMRFPCSKGKRKPRRYPKTLKEQEEDDSECDSICSFDSEICLTGVKLTAKDMEEIKKYQREAQKSEAKLEKN